MPILSEDSRQFLRLLVDGKRDEAARLGQSLMFKLYDRMGEIEAEISLLEETLEVLKETTDAQVGGDSTNGRASRGEKRLAVLDAAAALVSASPSGRVTTDSIHDFMVRKGQVPPNKTAIGLVMNKATGREKVTKGIYILAKGEVAMSPSNGNPKADMTTPGFSTVELPVSMANTTMDADGPTSDEIDELPF